MKKIILLILSVFVFIPSSRLFAQNFNMGTTKSIVADGVTLEHSTIPEMLYCRDKLFIDIDGKQTEILDSEGRMVKQVIPLDLDSDGKLEYIVSMDCGGSAAIYDICIIKEESGKWVPIWEDSYSQPEITVKDPKGKPSIKILYFDNPKETEKKASTELIFKNDRIIESNPILK